MARPAADRFTIRRAYDGAGEADGHRVLVDRLWPRGVAKDRAAIDEWAKDVAPSTELRRWYGHEPERFDEFARRYRAELAEPPGAAVVERLRRLAADGGRVTLVTATRDVERSGAKVLLDVLVE